MTAELQDTLEVTTENTEQRRYEATQQQKSRLITVKGLHRYFEVGDSKVHALNNVNLDVEPGEFIAVMGPSGSGKSTLMNVLGCLDTPNEGQYSLLDKPVANLDDMELSDFRNRYIGFVFQSFHLLPRLTALENVQLPLRFAKDGISEARQRSYNLLNRLGLDDRRTHRPNQLSGGQRQRVAIARALVTNPLLLLADEPTGNLDSKTAAGIMKLLVELNTEGQTIILVTHEDEIARHASRIIHMRDGEISYEQTSREQGFVDG